jgi:proliferating cell nuclear antigen PCNA
MAQPPPEPEGKVEKSDTIVLKIENVPVRSSKYLLLAKTREAYAIKVMVESLQFYIKEGGNFEFTNKGVKICCIDQGTNKQHRVFIKGRLLAENFARYICNQERITSINLTVFHKFIRPTKKKDSVAFTFAESNPKLLNIRVGTDGDKGNYSESSIGVIDTQQINMTDMDYDLGRPIVIPAKEFQKMCRGLNNITPTMEITCSSKGVVHCLCVGNNIGHKDYIFNDDVDDFESKDADTIIYRQHFPTRCITFNSKLAGLGTNVTLYPTSEQLPLALKMNIGSLGELIIFIKSTEQMDVERGATTTK